MNYDNPTKSTPEREESIIGLDDVPGNLEAHHTENKQSPKKNKKWLVITLVIIILASIAAIGWFMFGSKSTIPTNNQTDVAESIPAAQDSLFAVTYAYGDAEKDGMELFWRPVDGGDRTSAKNIGQNNYITNSSVQGQQVLVVTSPAGGSSSGDTIWYSKDAGKTYKFLFSLSLPDPGKPSEIITSAIFSSDGKSIVYGYLAASDKQANVIRQVNLETNETADLFSVNTMGSFLEGYDAERGKIYFYKGCYNCDGNVQDTLYVYDTATKTEEVVFTLAGKAGAGLVISSDFTKMLTAQSDISGDGIGPGPPYVLSEFDIGTKNFKELTKIGKQVGSPIFGYRSGTTTAYFAKENTIYGVGQDGEVKLFEADKPIVNVLYVGSDSIVVGVGTFEDYVLSNFSLSMEKSIEILNGDQSTFLFGTTSQ